MSVVTQIFVPGAMQDSTCKLGVAPATLCKRPKLMVDATSRSSFAHTSSLNSSVIGFERHYRTLVFNSDAETKEKSRFVEASSPPDETLRLIERPSGSDLSQALQKVTPTSTVRSASSFPTYPLLSRTSETTWELSYASLNPYIPKTSRPPVLALDAWATSALAARERFVFRWPSCSKAAVIWDIYLGRPSWFQLPPFSVFYPGHYWWSAAEILTKPIWTFSALSFAYSVSPRTTAFTSVTLNDACPQRLDFGIQKQFSSSRSSATFRHSCLQLTKTGVATSETNVEWTTPFPRECGRSIVTYKLSSAVSSCAVALDIPLGWLKRSIVTSFQVSSDDIIFKAHIQPQSSLAQSLQLFPSALGDPLYQPSGTLSVGTGNKAGVYLQYCYLLYSGGSETATKLEYNVRWHIKTTTLCILELRLTRFGSSYTIPIPIVWPVQESPRYSHIPSTTMTSLTSLLPATMLLFTPIVLHQAVQRLKASCQQPIGKAVSVYSSAIFWLIALLPQTAQQWLDSAQRCPATVGICADKSPAATSNCLNNIATSLVALHLFPLFRFHYIGVQTIANTLRDWMGSSAYDALQRALLEQDIMDANAQRFHERELQGNGFVIEKALYGSGFSQQMKETEAKHNSKAYPKTPTVTTRSWSGWFAPFDVTTPLRFTIRESRLYLQKCKSYSFLPGFFNPHPFVSKSLYIKYRYHNKVYEKTFQDGAQVLLP